MKFDLNWTIVYFKIFCLDKQYPFAKNKLKFRPPVAKPSRRSRYAWKVRGINSKYASVLEMTTNSIKEFSFHLYELNRIAYFSNVQQYGVAGRPPGRHSQLPTVKIPDK